MSLFFDLLCELRNSFIRALHPILDKRTFQNLRIELDDRLTGLYLVLDSLKLIFDRESLAELPKCASRGSIVIPHSFFLVGAG